MPPLVSVVMNCYNSSRFLRQAIDSVYAQTYGAWEIVLWDDGSTDDSLAIAGTYDERLRVFCGEHVGLGPARNKALAECRGDIVAFLDCDDVWMPGKLERQIPLFDDPSVALVYSDGYVIDSAGARRSRMFDASAPARGRVFDALIVANFIPLVSALMRRTVLTEVGVFRAFSYAEEYDLFLRIAARHAVEYVDDALVDYRVHDGNFSHQGDFVYGEEIQIREEWLAQTPDGDAAGRSRINNVLRRLHANYSWWLLRQGRNRDARHEAAISLRMSPSNARPLLVYGLSFVPAVISRSGLDALRRARGPDASRTL